MLPRYVWELLNSFVGPLFFNSHNIFHSLNKCSVMLWWLMLNNYAELICDNNSAIWPTAQLKPSMQHSHLLQTNIKWMSMLFTQLAQTVLMECQLGHIDKKQSSWGNETRWEIKNSSSLKRLHVNMTSARRGEVLLIVFDINDWYILRGPWHDSASLRHRIVVEDCIAGWFGDHWCSSRTNCNCVDVEFGR